ncbi:MAG: hypothetical protein JWN98_241 [Abditibacteriota bacterium]|nr:hypothetical protein [Abditibacteriota bacterium]
MKRITLNLFLAASCAFLVPPAWAQGAVAQTANTAQVGSPKPSIPKPGAFKIGDKIEADYLGWYPGKVIEVLYNGDQYKIELYPPDGGKSFVYLFPKFRLRAATASPLPKNNTQPSGKLVFGKYGCTATSYRGGFVEYIMRGSFVISKSGQYTYYGFQKPSKGRFTVDKSGNLHFKGGYFNGGKAEKIDRPNKFFLTFPANPDHRWTCGLVNAK